MIKTAEEQKISIGSYCRLFRQTVLNYTLSEVSKFSDVGIKTISMFENGHSSNLLLLINVYWNACSDEEQKEDFLRGLFYQL